jgi:hypothetical protein
MRALPKVTTGIIATGQIGTALIQISPPAVGTERYRFRSLLAGLICDATVGNRYVVLRRMAPDNNALNFVMSVDAFIANGTKNVSITPGTAQTSNSVNSFFSMIVPEFEIAPGEVLQLLLNNGQAGDIWGQISTTWNVLP